MEIAEVESFAVSIPLDEPVSFATRTVEERDHAITYVRTADGTEGLSYTLGYGGASLVADAVTDVLAPMIEGEDPLIEDGSIAVPESPGLGVELDEDVAAEHAKGDGDLWS